VRVTKSTLRLLPRCCKLSPLQSDLKLLCFKSWIRLFRVPWPTLANTSVRYPAVFSNPVDRQTSKNMTSLASVGCRPKDDDGGDGDVDGIDVKTFFSFLC